MNSRTLLIATAAALLCLTLVKARSEEVPTLCEMKCNADYNTCMGVECAPDASGRKDAACLARCEEKLAACKAEC